MKKPSDPRELAVAMLSRSTCSVQVGAVLVDDWGIFAWGHNHSGADGLGQHAERDCLRRANWRRSQGATMYVASRRQRNQKIVNSMPCPECQMAIQNRGIEAWYRDESGLWRLL